MKDINPVPPSSQSSKSSNHNHRRRRSDNHTHYVDWKEIDAQNTEVKSMLRTNMVVTIASLAVSALGVFLAVNIGKDK